MKALKNIWARVRRLFVPEARLVLHDLAFLYINGELLADVRKCSFTIENGSIAVRGVMTWLVDSGECLKIVELARTLEHVRAKVLMGASGHAWLADGAVVKTEVNCGVGFETELEFEFRGKLTA